MQATVAQLGRLNALRRQKRYVPIHPDDWVGVSTAQAERLIVQWTTIGPARR